MNSTSAPSASDVSVVLISSQHWVTGSKTSRHSLIRSWIFQKLRKTRVQKSRCTSSHGLRIQPVGDRRKSSRLDEANQVGRDSHAHFVPSAQQLTTDSSARLDIAASSITGQHKFHRGDRSLFTFRTRKATSGVGHHQLFLD